MASTPVGPTGISFTFDTGTHDLSVTATLQYAGGASATYSGSVPGYLYDQYVAVAGAYFSAATLINGAAGPVVPGDVARLAAVLANIQTTPPPPNPPASSLQFGTAPDVPIP